MVTEVEAVTGLVETLNVALAVPSGTVTESGTLATVGSLLDKETIAPPAGAAGPLSVTVPLEEPPPVTVAGSRFNPKAALRLKKRLKNWKSLLVLTQVT